MLNFGETSVYQGNHLIVGTNAISQLQNPTEFCANRNWGPFNCIFNGLTTLIILEKRPPFTLIPYIPHISDAIFLQLSDGWMRGSGSRVQVFM
jgi:hypothetical protein